MYHIKTNNAPSEIIKNINRLKENIKDIAEFKNLECINGCIFGKIYYPDCLCNIIMKFDKKKIKKTCKHGKDILKINMMIKRIEKSTYIIFDFNKDGICSCFSTYTRNLIMGLLKNEKLIVKEKCESKEYNIIPTQKTYKMELKHASDKLYMIRINKEDDDSYLSYTGKLKLIEQRISNKKTEKLLKLVGDSIINYNNVEIFECKEPIWTIKHDESLDYVIEHYIHSRKIINLRKTK